MTFFGLKGEGKPESYQFSMFNMAKIKSRHRITFKYSVRRWKMERLYSEFSANACRQNKGQTVSRIPSRLRHWPSFADFLMDALCKKRENLVIFPMAGGALRF